MQNHQVMEIEYERLKEPKLVRRRVLPVGIMFSEYYFYLTAFLEDKKTFDNPDDLFPTSYRIDRIRDFNVLEEHFKVPHKDHVTYSTYGTHSYSLRNYSEYDAGCQCKNNRTVH